jgi:ATP-dependent DNA helicase PIF1
VFVDMLNALRFGRLDAPTIAAFMALSRPIKYEDGIEPSELYPTRREVDYSNQRRLNAIKAEIHRYDALDKPGRTDDGKPVSQEQANKVLERLMAPGRIMLKVSHSSSIQQNVRAYVASI